MPQYNGSLIQRGFQSGELTPSLWPRTDEASYAHGAKTARNVYIQREGGLTNRPGTVCIAPVKDSSAGRIKFGRFVFNNAQAYALEFGDHYMRVYRGGTQIQANASAWSSTVSYVQGDMASNAGVSYYCIQANTNIAPPDSAFWYPLTDGIFEIPTPYAIADLPLLQTRQLKNYMYMVCQGNGGANYQTQKLTCGGDTNWVLNTPLFIPTTAQPGSGDPTPYPTFADPSGLYPWFGATAGYINFPNPGANPGHWETPWTLQAQGTIISPGANGIPSAGTDDAKLSLDINRYIITAVDLETGIESFPMQGCISGWKVYIENTSLELGVYYNTDDPFREHPRAVNIGVNYSNRFNQINSQAILSLDAAYPLIVNVANTGTFGTTNGSGNDYFTFSGTGIPDLDGRVFQGNVSSGSVVFTNIDATGYPTTVPTSAELICLSSYVVSATLNPSSGMTPSGNVAPTWTNGQPVQSPANPFEITSLWNPVGNILPNTITGWESETIDFFNYFFVYEPLYISWSAPSTPGEYIYNVYRMNANGQYGLIAVSSSTNFTDIGAAPNISESIPDYTAIGNGNIGNPSTIGAFQQRLILANTPINKDWVYASNTGEYETFTVTNPAAVNSDTVQFELAGSEYNPVTQIVDNAFMLLFTDTGEFSCFGAGNAYAPGPLTPEAIGLTQQGYFGANQALSPITVGKNVLYVQALQSKVRELIFTYMFQGYVGEDDTVNSEHLFDGYTLTDWAYQQEPNSIVWAVRNDGVLLSMTYLPELKMKGWTRHDTAGQFESIVTIPEGTEHAIYVEVNRNGTRYIERMANQTIPVTTIERPVPYGNLVGTLIQKKVPDWTAWCYMDCSSYYDGKSGTGGTLMVALPGDYSANGAGFVMDASGGVWSGFTPDMVGSAVILYSPTDGSAYKCVIIAFQDPYHALCRPELNLPTNMQDVVISSWAIGIKTVSGLTQFPDGTQVAVLADGAVLSSYATPTWLTVENGSVTLDNFYAFIRVGLPYLSDVRSLDIDTQSEGQTAKDKPQLINRVACYFKDTRGVYVGTQPPWDDQIQPLENMTEFLPRMDESMGQMPWAKTGIQIAAVDAQFAYGANAFIRQPNPLPMTLSAVVVAGKYMIGS